MDLEKQLREGLSEISELAIDTTQLSEQLVRYIELIMKWNSTYNLTSIRKPESMVTRHMLDSLVVLPHIKGSSIIDVGSGAGLPGIPVALACPDWQITLVESNQKKAAFLQQAIIELQLQNVTIRQERAEKMVFDGKVDTVISRAFSSLERFMQVSKQLCANNREHCRFIAMKGAFPDLELMQLSVEFVVEKVVAVVVPGLKAKRHLIIMQYCPE